MDTSGTHVVTQLLAAAADGDGVARERLLDAVYDELRRMAAAQMARERPGHTLQPTALVHDAWLRLVGGGPSPGSAVDAGTSHPAPAGGLPFANRRHFFAAAAIAMRRIRIDSARRRSRLKRGGPGPGGAESTPARGPVASADGDGEAVWFDSDPLRDLAIDEALQRLERERPELAEVVQLRFFAEFSVDQAAEVLGVTPRTVDFRWAMARAWLKRVLE